MGIFDQVINIAIVAEVQKMQPDLSWGNQCHAGKIGLVSLGTARQQRTPQHSRMCANEKIGQYIIFLAAPPPVEHEGYL